MTKHIITLLIFSLILFILMLMVGSELITSFLFSISIFIGLLNAKLLKGTKTIWGLLLYILTYKYILIAAILKIISLSPIDQNLKIPILTTFIVFLSFLGILFAIIFFKKISNLNTYKEGLLLKFTFNKKDYLIMTFLLIVFGSIGSLLRQLSDGDMPYYYKLFTLFIPLSSLAIYTFVEYFYKKGKKNYLFNIYILILVTFQISIGLLSASKADLMLPILIYSLIIIKHKGFFYKPLHVTLVAVSFIFIFIIYPYSQVVRYMGVKEGSFEERLAVIEKINFNVLEKGINEFEKKYGDRSYLPIYLMSLNRFAMIGEANVLINATYKKQDFTNFETIIWGLQYASPSFVPWKKPVGTGNYLGHYTGQIAMTDDVTNISYGIFANAYNAFNLDGVLLIVFIFYLVFFFYTYAFFGNPMPFSFYWFILFISYQHVISEATIAGFTALLLRLPFSIFLLILMLKTINFIFFSFPKKRRYTIQGKK